MKNITNDYKFYLVIRFLSAALILRGIDALYVENITSGRIGMVAFLCIFALMSVIRKRE